MKIELDNICYCYDKKKGEKVKSVNYTLESGFNYILTGANGSGKTTLSKLITGIFKPSSGEIRIDGRSTRRMTLSEISGTIGYLFQNPDHQLFAGTVKEELAFPYEISGALNPEIEAEIDGMLARFNLNALRNRFPLTLSGGEKQRLALATVFIRDVQFLVLDEPFSAIDSEGKSFLISLLNDFVLKGGGALIITHDTEMIGDLVNKIDLTMEDGRIEA